MTFSTDNDTLNKLFRDETWKKGWLWLVFILWALFVSQLWLPRNWQFYGIHDWDLTYSSFEAARKSVIEYGQWPVFNPWVAFGTDMVSNPQSVHVSIFFIPVLLFGSFYGYKCSILIAMIIGCWGAFKLFNAIGGSRFIALCGALLFCGSSYFARHIFEAGHSNVLYFYFLPGILFLCNALSQKFRFWPAILLLFMLVQLIAGGAPFVWMATAICVFLISCGLVITKRFSIKKLWPVAVIFVGSLFVSAFKLWPVMRFWQEFPRKMIDDSGINPLLWLQSMGDYSTTTGNWHGWFELSLGFEIILLGLLIYYRNNISNWWKWLIILIPVLWFSIGNYPQYFNPWYILNHYFPVFNSMRAPYRMGILIVLFLNLGLIIALVKASEQKLLRFILLFAVISQAVHFNAISKLHLNSPLIGNLDVPRHNEFIKPIKLQGSQKDIQYLYIKNNYTVQNAYEPMFLGEVRDSFPDILQNAHFVYFSPNRMSFKIDSNNALLNLRYSENWEASGKGNAGGSISLGFKEAEDYLVYRNEPEIAGWIISGISIVFLLCFIWIFMDRDESKWYEQKQKYYLRRLKPGESE